MKDVDVKESKDNSAVSIVMNPLSTATKEEQLRRDAQYQELATLANLTSKAIKESSINKETLLKILDEDIYIAKEITKTFKAGADPFPLVYNKLPYLLQGAKILIDKFFDQIASCDYSFVPISEFYTPDPYSKFTTSIPSYVQTALLEILSIVKKKAINEIPDLQKEKIYDINYSPNIQGIKSADPKTLELALDWRWCSKFDKVGDKDYHELMVPGFGYYFGGSRYDDHYSAKQFRQEDCSSMVAKWTAASLPFTTQNILDILNPDKAQSSDYNKAAHSVLKPIGADRLPIAGDIFCFPGHCGIVTKCSDLDGPMFVLSDTRLMPFAEGLIYQQYAQVNNGKNIVKADWEALSKLGVEDYYGLDNALKEHVDNIYPVDLSGDIHYFEAI